MSMHHTDPVLVRTISDGCPLGESVDCVKEMRTDDVLVGLKGAIGRYRVRIDFVSPLTVARFIDEIILPASLLQLEITSR